MRPAATAAGDAAELPEEVQVRVAVQGVLLLAPQPDGAHHAADQADPAPDDGEAHEAHPATKTTTSTTTGAPDR